MVLVALMVEMVVSLWRVLLSVSDVDGVGRDAGGGGDGCDVLLVLVVSSACAGKRIGIQVVPLVTA